MVSAAIIRLLEYFLLATLALSKDILLTSAWGDSFFFGDSSTLGTKTLNFNLNFFNKSFLALEDDDKIKFIIIFFRLIICV